MTNRINHLYGIKYPIIQGGMVWNSSWRLAAAVSEAGGLGLIGAASMYPEVLREHIQKCRKATQMPFGVNIPLLYPDIDQLMKVVFEENIYMFCLNMLILSRYDIILYIEYTFRIQKDILK